MTYAEHGEIISRLWVPGTSSSGNERLIVLSMFRPAKTAGTAAETVPILGSLSTWGAKRSWHTG
jgi:hypothetical protein